MGPRQAAVPSLDTNVVVRLLVADDAAQGEAARALVRRQSPLFVPLTVVLELEWVLRSRYRYPKTQVLGALSALLEARELVFQAEEAVEHALHFYRRGKADFAECMHLGCAAAEGHLPMMTFDRRAARLTGARRLGAA